MKRPEAIIKTDHITIVVENGSCGSTRTPALLFRQLLLATISPGSSLFGFLCEDVVMCIFVPSRSPGSVKPSFSVQGKTRGASLAAFTDKVRDISRHPVSATSPSFPKRECWRVPSGEISGIATHGQSLGRSFPGGR